jgi:signal peptidase
MNPTLKSGDRLCITPYDGQKIRRGDVVVFVPPGGDSKIIHRVVSIHSQRIKTRGDNNNELDHWVLKPDQILGRVVATQRNNRRRRIFGGPLGRLFALTVRVIRAIDLPVSYLLRPAYSELAKVSIFTRLLPVQMRPRVVSFEQAAGQELQLLMGRRVVGRWLPGMTRWYIRRPFRLFVDEESLPQNPGKGSVVRCK